MSGTWESDEKINIARQILTDIVDSLESVDNVQMALRVYGHQSPVPPQDCSDTKLEVPFAPNNASRIRQKLKYITPKGTTPIAHSLELAVTDFPPCPNCRNIIVLITDGIEACDGDPCAVSLELQRKGIILKPFVIGIGLDPGFRETFECVGYYYNARQENKFKQTLGFVINQALNQTTAQVNLLDEKGYPTETNVNMTFYDRYTGRVVYNYVHTMNKLGNPDTLELDPLVTYRLKVFTIPPVVDDSVSITPGTHTVISLYAPQGYLLIRTSRTNEYENLPFIIRKHGENKTLNTQRIGQMEKYITGSYDIEIPILPRLNIDDVKVQQSHTTTLEIPGPGSVRFTSTSHGFGSIYVLENGSQKWVTNLNPALRQQDLLLQPGYYRVIFRPATAKQTLSTISRDFRVGEADNVTVNLN
jgi:Ca-activated chloride channel family protein